MLDLCFPLMYNISCCKDLSFTHYAAEGDNSGKEFGNIISA